jgi:putative transposase
MAHLLRLVLPGIADYLMQRGNQRAQSFFNDADYALYRQLQGQVRKPLNCGGYT